MYEKISKNIAEKYTLTTITYLDEEANNFVSIFHNIDDNRAPVIRTMVKYHKVGILGCVTAKVSVIGNSKIIITDEAERIFKGTAVESVQTMCKCEEQTTK